VVSAAAALVPCTCGELVQGIRGDEPFLVSCPIDLYSRVTAIVGYRPASASSGEPSASQEWVGVAEPGMMEPPPDENDPYGRATVKARMAAEATLALLGWRGVPFSLRIERPLPPSKGFGTSTADVVGAVAATAAAIGRRLQPEAMAHIAVSVEPSDSTMFPGLAIFDHRSGRRWEPLGNPPPLLIAVLEMDGEVDTQDYNARLDLAALRSLEPEHRMALDLLREGLRTGRLEMIGRAASASARANQRLLPKPYLEEIIAMGERFGALGVCVAHSGTAVGVLFGPDARNSAARLVAAATSGGITRPRRAWISRLAAGGARILPQSEDGQKDRQGVPPRRRIPASGARTHA